MSAEAMVSIVHGRTRLVQKQMCAYTSSHFHSASDTSTLSSCLHVNLGIAWKHTLRCINQSTQRQSYDTCCSLHGKYNYVLILICIIVYIWWLWDGEYDTLFVCHAVLIQYDVPSSLIMPRLNLKTILASFNGFSSCASLLPPLLKTLRYHFPSIDPLGSARNKRHTSNKT
jgi:hypothetical protein